MPPDHLQRANGGSLQDISYEDAIAEGVECDEIGHYANYLDRADDAVIGNWLGPQSSYSTIWNSLHGVNAWRENPWVWAYTFTRVGQ